MSLNRFYPFLKISHVTPFGVHCLIDQRSYMSFYHPYLQMNQSFPVNQNFTIFNYKYKYINYHAFFCDFEQNGYALQILIFVRKIKKHAL